MLNVKNNQTGKVQELSDDSDLPNLVESGKVSLPNQEFEFESTEGEKYAVPANKFLEAVKQGWKYRDNTVKREEEMQAKYGDSTVKALLYGGARGLTFGLSDPLLTATGLETPEALSEIKKRNSEASIGAEVVGDTGLQANIHPNVYRAGELGPGVQVWILVLPGWVHCVLQDPVQVGAQARTMATVGLIVAEATVNELLLRVVTEPASDPSKAGFNSPNGGEGHAGAALALAFHRADKSWKKIKKINFS